MFRTYNKTRYNLLSFFYYIQNPKKNSSCLPAGCCGLCPASLSTFTSPSLLGVAAFSLSTSMFLYVSSLAAVPPLSLYGVVAAAAGLGLSLTDVVAADSGLFLTGAAAAAATAVAPRPDA